MAFRNTIVNIAWSNPSNTLDNTYTYDGNGKILTMTRKGTSNSMDDLTAHYYANTNRLEYVDDAVSSGTYSTDIDDQSAGNYQYTAIGERAKDTEGGIDTITWTVYGKMKALKRNNGDSLIFTYDAMNNRVMKRKKLSAGTETVIYYLRDATGNILSMYERTTSGGNYLYTQTEVPIYGSDRLGEFKPNIIIKTIPIGGTCCGGGCVSCVVYPWTINVKKNNGYFGRDIAKKEYELKDHLGDVHITVSDRKTTGNFADLLSYTNYYTGGAPLPGKTYNSQDYRFGYQGSEMVNEVNNTTGRHYTTEFREYDSDIMMWWSPDPLQSLFASHSPYNYAFNNPICFNDPDGLGPKDVIKNVKGWVNRNVLGRTSAGVKLTKVQTEEREVTFKQPEVLADINQNDFKSNWEESSEKPTYEPININVTKQHNFAQWGNISEVQFKFNNIGEGENISITRPGLFGGQKEIFNEQFQTTQTQFFKTNRLAIPNSLDLFNTSFKYTLVFTPEWTPPQEFGQIQYSVSGDVFGYYRSYKMTVKMRATEKYFDALKKSHVIE